MPNLPAVPTIFSNPFTGTLHTYGVQPPPAPPAPPATATTAYAPVANPPHSHVVRFAEPPIVRAASTSALPAAEMIPLAKQNVYTSEASTAGVPYGV